MLERPHIRFDRLECELNDFKIKFHSARPFEYVVIDNFLNENSLHAVHEAIPDPDEDNKSSDYVFAKNKFENPRFSGGGEVFTELREELLSGRFAAILSAIYGCPLFVDPKFLGGGIHQGGEGSYLDMHADFNRHPSNKDWMRELNILLYLNKDYKDEYSGHLELHHARTGEQGRVAPINNRLVLMLTKEHTLHGYKPIRFPKGSYRTSLAAYAYSIDTDFDAIPARSTLWKPQDAGLAKSLLARAAPSLVKIKTALLGSSTEKRTQGDKSD